MKVRVPLKDWKRFLRFIQTHEPELCGCWRWNGYCNKKGYGHFRFNGKIWYAHRFAWHALVGEIPNNDTIEHTCLNTSCVNPDHYVLISRSENTANGNVTRHFTDDMSYEEMYARTNDDIPF